MEPDQRTMKLLKTIIDRLKNVELRTAAAMRKATDNENAIRTVADNTQKIVMRIEKVLNLSPKPKEKQKWVF